MGIPKDVVTSILNMIDCNVFIETGTYRGQTSIWASNHFKEIHTIEFSKEIHAIAKENIKASGKKIHLYFGDSRSNLDKIYKSKSESALLWLDAHWCSGLSYGEEDQCPLIDELDVINKANHDDIILIDDARLFAAPPPLPNETKYYPDLAETVGKLLEIDRYIAIFEDVIFAVPTKHKKFFQDLLQEYTTQEWHKTKASSFREKIVNSKGDLKRLIKNWI